MSAGFSLYIPIPSKSLRIFLNYYSMSRYSRNTLLLLLFQLHFLNTIILFGYYVLIVELFTLKIIFYWKKKFLLVHVYCAYICTYVHKIFDVYRKYVRKYQSPKMTRTYFAISLCILLFPTSPSSSNFGIITHKSRRHNNNDDANNYMYTSIQQVRVTTRNSITSARWYYYFIFFLPRFVSFYKAHVHMHMQHITK